MTVRIRIPCGVSGANETKSGKRLPAKLWLNGVIGDITGHFPSMRHRCLYSAPFAGADGSGRRRAVRGCVSQCSPFSKSNETTFPDIHHLPGYIELNPRRASDLRKRTAEGSPIRFFPFSIRKAVMIFRPSWQPSARGRHTSTTFDLLIQNDSARSPPVLRRDGFPAVRPFCPGPAGGIICRRRTTALCTRPGLVPGSDSSCLPFPNSRN